MVNFYNEKYHLLPVPFSSVTYISSQYKRKYIGHLSLYLILKMFGRYAADKQICFVNLVFISKRFSFK